MSVSNVSTCLRVGVCGTDTLPIYGHFSHSKRKKRRQGEGEGEGGGEGGDGDVSQHRTSQELRSKDVVSRRATGNTSNP